MAEVRSKGAEGYVAKAIWFALSMGLPSGSPMSGAERDFSELNSLMAKAQGGDEAAYRRLLREIAPLLRSLCRQGLRNAADAEDALQDILLTLHRVRHTYDPARPFLPWLFAVGRRRIIDSQRRLARHRQRHVELSGEETFGAAEANSEGMDMDFRALHVAIQALPPAQRRAIEMLKLKELSLKEATAASGMSIPSLKVATHRGLKSLREKLAAPRESDKS